MLLNTARTVLHSNAINALHFDKKASVIFFLVEIFLCFNSMLIFSFSFLLSFRKNYLALFWFILFFWNVCHAYAPGTEVEKFPPRQILKVRKEVNNNATCRESDISYKERGCADAHSIGPNNSSSQMCTEHKRQIIISIIKGEIRMKHFSIRIKRQKENWEHTENPCT